MHRPTVVVIAGLMDDERTMSGLLPVARIASPIRVRRNSVRNRTISAAAARAVRSLYCPASGVPASADFIRENTVCVLLRLSSDAPPIMAMLMEYSAVFTMMPANRLLMPMRVCKTETISPDSSPAAIAAKIASIGCPAIAVTAPVTAPSVKQPSVERSQTFSIE